MAERTLTIVNKLGLHARAAARLVQTASKFKSDVWVEREGQRVNGKSIMGVLMLAAAQGTQIRLQTEGEDEDEALDALGALVEDGFGEDRG